MRRTAPRERRSRLAEFGDRLAAALYARGPLCVGIDPHAELLAAWGLPDSGAGVREFGLRVVEAAAGRAGVVKPQNSFFERHGAAGYTALEEVLAAARAAGLVVISDVKRGDIGSTVDAYGEAWLTPGSPLEADAITALAYQGVGSLDGVLDLARRAGKGVFVLAATSNPEAAAVQRATRADGASVAAGVVRDLAARPADPARLRPFGVVIGATVTLADYGIDPAELVGTPVLAPGFGAQGARLSDLRELYGPAAGSVVASASRSLLSAGPDDLARAIGLAAAEAAAEVAA